MQRRGNEDDHHGAGDVCEPHQRREERDCPAVRKDHIAAVDLETGRCCCGPGETKRTSMASPMSNIILVSTVFDTWLSEEREQCGARRVPHLHDVDSVGDVVELGCWASRTTVENEHVQIVSQPERDVESGEDGHEDHNNHHGPVDLYFQALAVPEEGADTGCKSYDIHTVGHGMDDLRAL